MTSRSEKEARIERGRQVLRREGMADAALRLVATGFTPGRTVSDYQVALGLSQLDMQRAVERRRSPLGTPAASRPGANPAAKPGRFVCPEHGCTKSYDDQRGLASHRIAAHTPPVLCPNGCGRIINPRGIGPHLKHCAPPAGRQ